jgi:hypothetical protein
VRPTALILEECPSKWRVRRIDLTTRRYGESGEAYTERLKEDLYVARATLLEVLPEQFRQCLKSFRSVSTERDFDPWRGEVIEKIIELTEGGPENRFGERRAPCPLCNDEGSDYYLPGFKLDEGLRRHLSGSHKASQCSVTREAFAFARDCLRDKIQRAKAPDPNPSNG